MARRANTPLVAVLPSPASGENRGSWKGAWRNMSVDAKEREVQQITVRVPRDVHDALKTLSMATGRPVNEIVQSALGEYLAGDGHRQAVEAFVHEALDTYKTALDKLADL
jgi:hypothetical protein